MADCCNTVQTLTDILKFAVGEANSTPLLEEKFQRLVTGVAAFKAAYEATDNQTINLPELDLPA
jgi:hypothetical protein